MIALDRFTAKTSLVIKISSLRMRIEKVPYEACISPEMPRIYFKISICIDRCIFNITYYLSSNIFLINKVLIFSMYHQMYIYFIMQNILPKNRKKGSLFFSILCAYQCVGLFVASLPSFSTQKAFFFVMRDLSRYTLFHIKNKIMT